MRDIKGIPNKILVILLICLSGCSGHKVTSAQGYLKYLFNKKNGMVQDKSIDALKYEAIYMTPEAMTLGELKDNVTQAKYMKLLPEYNGMQYVRFSIKANKLEHVFNAVKEEGKDPDRIEEYLNLQAQEDFMLISGGDTSRCGLYSFSRTYGLGHDWQLLLGFEKKDTTGDVYLQYNDMVADNGTLSFKIKRDDIKKLPTINFSL